MDGNTPFTNHIPPRIEEVKVYFNQRGVKECEAEAFFLFYEAKNWTSKRGNYLKNWKTIAYHWIWSIFRKDCQLFNRHIH